MKSFCHRIPILILILLFQGSGCKQDDGLKPLPDVTIAATPSNGNTTDVFEIKISPLNGQGPDIQYFYRWDWTGDGIWDTKFSSGNVEKHRYYQPGNQVIKIEIIDGKKQIRSFSTSVQVAQGYSPPKANFLITPATGNPTVEFTFDATSTRDDEDSLGQLEFRWDPLGDGRWLMQYSSKPVAKYKYSRAGFYTAKLQVKDPSGRTSTFSRELSVNLQDTLILAEFNVTPDSIEVNHTAILDASGSRYPPDTLQPLLYSWLLPGTDVWTDPVKENKISHLFRQKGLEKISLKVINTANDFYNRITKEILVVDENLPPSARFNVSCPNGNVLTQFYFDAWPSRDDRLPPSELDVRWDFDGDGDWDTPYSKGKTLYHQFSQPGVFLTTLQVRDEENESVYQLKITVSGNNNPTSFFQDVRDGKYYGTVLIGNQWWMSQNLNFAVPGKMIKGFNQWLCLFEQSQWCDRVGKMYCAGAVIHNRSDRDFVEVCPSGWRLPSRDDWETLFSAIGGEQNGGELRLGGKYDFNAMDLGYADYTFVYEAGSVIPVDTIYNFKDTYRKSWFFSTTEPVDPQNLRVDIWMLNIDRGTGAAWMGYGMPLIYMPVRCIKEQ